MAEINYIHAPREKCWHWNEGCRKWARILVNGAGCDHTKLCFDHFVQNMREYYGFRPAQFNSDRGPKG